VTARRTVVIGGGIGGLSTARVLARRGHRVTVLESAPNVGGLAVGFDLGGVPLERYYHYVLPQERHILDLIEELGLGDKLGWFRGSIGVLTEGRVWPFTSPADLLRFAPLSMVDRVRAGIGALRLGRVREWEALDTVLARDWLTGLTSPAVTKVVWDPLLRAKFGPVAGQVPAAWMWGRLDQRRQARAGAGERIGYLRGGFGQMFEALADDLRSMGVDLRVSSPARAITMDGDRVTGVESATGSVDADVVVFAGTLPQLLPLMPRERWDERWAAARGLGALCVVLELSRPLTNEYWTNVVDPEVPFGGIIEHTNLVPPSWYGGRHVVYLSRYFTADEDVAAADADEEAGRWVKVLESLFPDFSADDVGAVHAFRTPYAAPLVTSPYLPQVAPIATGIEGLFLNTTAQIYPQDRGMNEGIRQAEIVAGVVTGDGWRCPVCDGRMGTEAYGILSDETEGGVDAAAFRPSSNEYGRTSGAVLRCSRCGHGSVASAPPAASMSDAYADAVDEVSLREEAGQVETADRALAVVERHVSPGAVLDIGCWTGSFLVAAQQRGWEPVGLEPSRWAADRARARGITVHNAEIDDVDLPEGSFRLVACCDVLEHLVDPGAALDRIAGLLEPGGALYLTVPDAGSRLARAMGKRWWAIVPMHVQYFTRASMSRLLERHGFDVRVVDTHPKVFSARYYAERVAGFVPGLGKLAVPAIERAGQGDRLVGPDFGDRMQVVAIRR
jgi:protoporphyrinogen oxidase/SAM-dependent methyltransferase